MSNFSSINTENRFSAMREITAKAAMRLNVSNSSENSIISDKPDFIQKQKNLFDRSADNFISQKWLEYPKSFKPSYQGMEAVLDSANKSKTDAQNMPSSISVLHMHCERNAKKPGDCGYQEWPYVQQAIRKQNLIPFKKRVRPCTEYNGWAALTSCQRCQLAIWELSINGKIFMGKRQDRAKNENCEILIPLTGEIISFRVEKV